MKYSATKKGNEETGREKRKNRERERKREMRERKREKTERNACILSSPGLREGAKNEGETEKCGHTENE